MFLVLPTPALGLSLTEVNKQINDINAQINQKRSEKSSLTNEIAIIDAQIAKVNIQLDATIGEINTLTGEINTTTVQINEATVKLTAEQEKLKEHLRVIYEEGNTSTLELVARSDTFSSFMDQREYLTEIQGDIKATADKINALKKELEGKKSQLEANKKRAEELRAAQEAQRAAQASQKAYKDQLLAQVRAQEQGLQGKLNDLHAQKAAMSASYGEAIVRGGTAYPYGNPPARRIIDTPDPWGYLIGECTSYAAWKRASIGRPVPRGLGNAKTWGTRAAAMGLSVTSTPRVGDVIVMPYVGYYGHVGYVDAVYANGTILMSEYNWIPYSYSQRVINPYNYSAQFIH